MAQHAAGWEGEQPTAWFFNPEAGTREGRAEARGAHDVPRAPSRGTEAAREVCGVVGLVVERHASQGQVRSCGATDRCNNNQ